MLRKLTTAAILLSLVLFSAGCGAGDDTRILSVHLVDHLKKNGLNGRFRRLNAESLGAAQGGRYASTDRDDPFLVEFAKFDDPEKARRFAKRGFRSADSGRVYPVYNHGPFAMIVRLAPKNRDIVTIFKKF